MMAEDANEQFQGFLNHLAGIPGQTLDRDGAAVPSTEPPERWVNQTVQLRKNGKSVESTLPSFMCQQAGIDRSQPPQVRVFYDPVTEVAIYDLGEYFQGVENDG